MDAIKNQQTRLPLIYVVDDEPMLLELIAAVLEPEGYQVCCFSDSVSALKHYSEANPKPDLLITDFAMPELVGTELISRCREQNASQKVLMISGTIEGPDFQDLPEQPDFFLCKPYQHQDLTEAVSRLIARSA